MSSTNILTASFNGRTETWASRHLWQWDYGQILQLPDLQLPASYQVHFANQPAGGHAYVVLGDEDGAAIPDTLLQTGLPINAWVFLQTGQDDGETCYKIFIPVDPRPRPSEETPTPAQQSALDEAIDLINEAAADLAAAEAGIPDAIAAALAEAKASGEFDGADGNGIWEVDVQFTRTVGGVLQAQIAHMNGRSDATPTAGDLCVISDGRLCEVQVITGAIARLTVLGDLAGPAGQDGTNGADGTTFTPSVSATGVISWSNDGGKPNPQSVDLVTAVLAALPEWEGGSY